MIMLTKQQARQFILLKHGLLDDYKFAGKQGALDFIRQAGCIQFDPVDACGKNAELTLQSRVKGVTKQMLYELLYEDRKLMDYPDKNLAIIPLEDWPYFGRYRRAAWENGLQFEGLSDLETMARNYIREHGAVSSEELPIEGSIHWHSVIHWSGNWHGTVNAARSVLEQLYSTGELIIHHKKGARKYYDLADLYIPGEILHGADPLDDEFEHFKWRILRRIGAVGFLWNRPSDAWLNIWNLKSPVRNDVFLSLLEEGKIQELKVEGIKDILYFCAKDTPLIETVMCNHKYQPRCELIAPLDCMMWDRKLIKALFDFEYTWEIYTPAQKRKYGFYVLPLLYGDRFVGRIEAENDRKRHVLIIKNIWYEAGVKQTKTLNTTVEKAVRRLARFNECDSIEYTNA